MHKRKANLDLLRAIAITVVFFFHLSQYITLPSICHKIAALGGYGVDLFFVLSGWLIGGIFFREYNSKGHVKLSNFWARRWLRTMPPYYVALLISWLAVYQSRHQPFDIKYLAFLQNYEEALPFFKISWSLCIEEHFYIFLPFFIYLAVKAKAVIPACIALVMLSFGMRWQYDASLHPAFGYQVTATHLRLDGLAIGVLCAYIYTIKFSLWQGFSRLLIRLGGISSIAAILIYFLNDQLMYSIGILAISVFFGGLLCLCINTADWSLSRSRIVYAIAVTSYSIYLVHALAINIANHFFSNNQLVFISGALAITGVASFIFHTSIEEVSKRVRDRFFPNRATTV